MRIGLITSTIYDNYSIVIINKLLENNIPVQLIVSEKTLTKKNIKKAVKKIGFKGIFNFVLNRLQIKDTGDEVRKDNSLLLNYIEENDTVDRVTDFKSINVAKVKDVNCGQSVKAVKDNKIDILIYGGGGILRRPLIQAPNVGILNAHLGELPFYRGMNVTEWMINDFKQPVITTHFIVEGIDTGDILLKKEIEIKGCESITDLRARAIYAGTDLIVETIKRLKSKDIEPVTQKAEDGKQFYTMTRSIKELVSKKLELMINGEKSEGYN